MEKSFSFEDALSLVLGNMVGTGIFAASPLLLQYAPSTGDTLLLWLLAGFIAYSGSMCFAELALLVPESGSEGTYIKNGFGIINLKLGYYLGYLFSWTAISLMKTASLAVMCDIFSSYFLNIFSAESTVFKIKFTSLLLISCLSLIANYSTSASKSVNNAMFLTKTSLVAWIIIAGLLANVFNRELCDGDINFNRKNSNYLESLTIGLFDAGFAFDGWSNLNYIASELNHVGDLVKALQVGVPVVSLSYFLLNMSYFIVLDENDILASQTVAVDFGHQILGNYGIIIPFLISLSALGAINGTIISNSRLMYSSAIQGDIPAVLTYLSVYKTPSFCILLNWILTCIYIILGDISSLINLISPFYYGFLFLSTISLVLIRLRKPRTQFRVHPFLLTFFLCMSFFLWLVPLFTNPLRWLLGLCIISIGLIVKWYVPDHYYETEDP